MLEKLKASSLLREARKRHAPLSDFGDPSFERGLEILCRSLNSDARLSSMGAQLLTEKLIAQLGNRLRVEDYFTRHPDIEDEVVAPPLFVVGIPRTGTTKLHRLLSQDRRFLWMSFWESQFPVPLDGETLESPDLRRSEGQKLVDMMVEAMPQLMAIHPMENEAADEEVMLMEHSFFSAFNAYAEVPSYMEWLDKEDQSPAYRYLHRMLQFLQWQKRKRGITGKRWVLKAPHHLLRMRVLLDTFPNAQVVLTHRDPVQSIPSLASFVHTLRCIYSEKADAASAGREWSDIMRRAWTHTSQVRDETSQPDNTFLDVGFRQTVHDPIAVAEEIYRFTGLDLDDGTRSAMMGWIETDAKQHQGSHSYNCDSFGLNEAGLRGAFADYCRRYQAFL